MSFRLVVWNCNMALHAKYERLLALGPHVAIIPECAAPDILRRKAPDFAYDDCAWYGLVENKGLGVFTFGGLTLRRHDSWDPRFHIFLPLEVRGAIQYNLLAVWAFNHRAPKSVVPSAVTTDEAIRYYSPFLCSAPTVVAGDFNANVIWDATGKYAKFADVDATLRALGLVSAYHAVNGHAMGQEPDPTLFWQKKAHQGFHIDYAYVPIGIVSHIEQAVVGAAEEWLSVSDHAPLVVDICVGV